MYDLINLEKSLGIISASLLRLIKIAQVGQREFWLIFTLILLSTLAEFDLKVYR